MFSITEKKELNKYLANVPEKSKVYLGCDSIRFKKYGRWKALYTVVLVVHIESSKGCKIFGYSEVSDDYDKYNKPTTRLMNEAYKVTELYNEVEDHLYNMDEIEIHLDVNPDKHYASNSVVNSAVGYVLGMTGIRPKIKPAANAFAASCAADMLCRQTKKYRRKG